jgi:hypothetical protein
MTLSIAVLPLRLTSPRLDLAGMLADLMDSDSSMDINSMDCRDDLQRLGQLRCSIAERFCEKDAYDEGIQIVPDIHEYYHCLMECEAKGLSGRSDRLLLEWESALTGELQVHTSLEWERANLIWNLACLEAYQASKQPLDSKVGCSKAAQSLQNAASWLQHLQAQPQYMDFSSTFLQFWQALLMAQSQRCVYESLACAPRPKHLLLAKLAAAAVPLFGEMETIVRKDEQSPQPVLNHFPSLSNNWVDFCRAWAMYMSCKAEHHQAMTSREKKQWGQELARLDSAYQFATVCCEFCERANLSSLQQLHTAVDQTVNQLRTRLNQAEHENAETHHQPVPPRQELTEIRGEKLVNIDQPLAKLLKPMVGEPLFQAVANTQHLRGYVQMFHSGMDKLVFQMSSLAEDRTESARKALATVNLPHSLTAYRQEQAGGGIPDDLWHRVQAIQRERRIAKLKQDLWELRDIAEAARMTYQKVDSELEFDLESDRLFRQGNQGFEGHDAEEVQKSFRQGLANYDRLLVTAQEGDTVLLRRLEILDTNPKYKLLQFQKSQLDRLLPGVGENPMPTIDTSRLSRLLVELSALFHEREVLLNSIKEEVKNFDIQGTLQSRAGSGSDQEYREALEYAQKSFDGMGYEMRTNIEKQTELVNSILAENEQFMMTRERTNNSQSADSCIVMIEDAIEEIEQLSKHLKEGKDFYDVVIPKLKRLKQQVGDVSARLTVERLEYDEKTNLSRQEEGDAMLAKRLSSITASTAHGHNNSNNNVARNPAQPGMQQVNHDEPQVFVDDEKVATLVDMEFDQAKVVAALMKYNNNVDQALNDLLSC